MPPFDWLLTASVYLVVVFFGLSSIMRIIKRPTAERGFYHASWAALGLTLTLEVVHVLHGEYRMMYTEIRPLMLTLSLVTLFAWFLVYLSLQTWGTHNENVRAALWMCVGWTLTAVMAAVMYVLPQYVEYLDHNAMLILPGYVFFGLGFVHSMVLPKAWQGWLGDRWLNAAFGCLFCSLLLFGFSLFLPWVAR